MLYYNAVNKNVSTFRLLLHLYIKLLHETEFAINSRGVPPISFQNTINPLTIVPDIKMKLLCENRFNFLQNGVSFSE
jgi:hypothetical protein